MPTDGQTFAPSLYMLGPINRWVTRRLGDTAHEHRVAEIAWRLFDLLEPRHGFRPAERRLLAMASLVHDVGRCVDEQTHPVQGMRMIQSDATMPLSGSDRRALAYLTRYHRGSVPDVGKDDVLTRFDDRHTLRTLLAILRVADQLDSRNRKSPRIDFSLQNRRLRIGCWFDECPPKVRRIYTRRKKLRLLEEVFGLRVDVQIRTAKAIPVVA